MIGRVQHSCFLLLIGCFLGSVRAAEPVILTSRDGRIQLHVPDGYSERTPPKAVISLEALNYAESATILVISEGQSQFDSLQAYGEIIRQMMLDKLKDAQSDSGIKLQISGNPAIRYEITGISSGGLRMGFLVTIIQTETRFTQVIGSCVRAQFSDRKDEFAKIAATLKEIPAKPAEKSNK
jgi:hypothetical protein